MYALANQTGGVSVANGNDDQRPEDDTMPEDEIIEEKFWWVRIGEETELDGKKQLVGLRGFRR